MLSKVVSFFIVFSFLHLSHASEFDPKSVSSLKERQPLESNWASRTKRLYTANPTKFCSRNPNSFVCSAEATRELAAPQTLSDNPFCPLDATADYDNCVGKFEYDDGDVYVGSWKENTMDGRGVYRFASGDKYIGQFSEGRPDGTGAYVFNDGSVNFGDWSDGAMNGGGVLLLSDGGVYVGELRDDKFSGTGVQITGRFKVAGEFLDDRPFSAAVYSDDNVLQGIYSDGKWCEGCPLTAKVRSAIKSDIRSIGSISWLDGIYSGFLKGSEPAFAGVHVFDSGTRYLGRWEEGVPHGTGLLLFSGGQIYVGEFEKGARSGFGMMAGKDNAFYVGSWADNERVGLAIQLLADLDGYFGLHASNAPEGQGLYRSSDGPTWIGSHKNGAPWDVVVFNDRGDIQGTVVKGEYCNGCTPSGPQLEKLAIGKLSGTGTGFVINSNHVVTAEHVVDQCKQVKLMQGSSVTTADVVKTDKAADLAVIRTKDRFNSFAGIRTNRVVQMGEPAINFGFPLYGELSSSAIVTSGIVSALSGFEDDPLYFQYDAATQFGNSGGPVLDQYGDIIGVVSAKLDDETTQLINFATKSTVLADFLVDATVSFERDSPVNNLGIPEIAIRASEFTVLVGCFE